MELSAVGVLGGDGHAAHVVGDGCSGEESVVGAGDSCETGVGLGGVAGEQDLDGYGSVGGDLSVVDGVDDSAVHDEGSLDGECGVVDCDVVLGVHGHSLGDGGVLLDGDGSVQGDVGLAHVDGVGEARPGGGGLVDDDDVGDDVPDLHVGCVLGGEGSVHIDGGVAGSGHLGSGGEDDLGVRTDV